MAFASSSALSVAQSHFNPVSAQIISLLNIPMHHVDRSASGLRVSYAKYLAYADAQKALAKLIADGGWPASQKKPKSKDLIEVFISKSAFFKNHQPYFPHIQFDYPELHLWLNGFGGMGFAEEHIYVQRLGGIFQEDEGEKGEKK